MLLRVALLNRLTTGTNKTIDRYSPPNYCLILPTVTLRHKRCGNIFPYIFHRLIQQPSGMQQQPDPILDFAQHYDNIACTPLLLLGRSPAFNTHTSAIIERDPVHITLPIYKYNTILHARAHQLSRGKFKRARRNRRLLPPKKKKIPEQLYRYIRIMGYKYNVYTPAAAAVACGARSPLTLRVSARV